MKVLTTALTFPGPMVLAALMALPFGASAGTVALNFGSLPSAQGFGYSGGFPYLQ